MTLVRLPDERLWVHSPVQYSESLRQAIGALGAVVAIVAPNSLHHTHLQAWADAYSSADVFCSPDLAERFDIERLQALADVAPRLWREEIEQHLVDCGSFKEVIFFHPRSHSLVVTDLMQAFEAERVVSPLTRLLLRAGGAMGPRAGPSLEIRLASLAHREALRIGVRRMLAWQPRNIILSHGRCFVDDGTAVIRDAYRWLL